MGNKFEWEVQPLPSIPPHRHSVGPMGSEFERRAGMCEKTFDRRKVRPNGKSPRMHVHNNNKKVEEK